MVLLVTTSRDRLCFGSLGSSRRLSSLDTLLSWSRGISSLFVTLSILLVLLFQFSSTFVVVLLVDILFLVLLGVAIGFLSVRLGRLALFYRRLGYATWSAYVLFESLARTQPGLHRC